MAILMDPAMPEGPVAGKRKSYPQAPIVFSREQVQALDGRLTEMRHTLNSPLTAIQLAAGVVMKRTGHTTELNLITDQIQNLLRLVRNYSREFERSIGVEWRAPAVVMLLDDDDNIRDLIGTCLRLFNLGIQVQEAATADEAFAQSAQHPPDLLICDLVRPGGDGLGFIRTFKITHAATPILVFSGGPSHLIKAASEAGATEVLGKPCAMEILKETVARLLDCKLTHSPVN